MLTTEKIYLQPKTVNDALMAAYDHINEFRYIAGGTDVLVNKFQGNEISSCLIDISGIDELNAVKISDGYFKIGALVKLKDLAKHEIIRNEFAALIEAANSVGSPLIRQAATIGGNILCENRCIYYNQSDWWRESVGYCLKCEGDICIATGSAKKCYSELVSDTAPVLISMNAQIEVADKEGITIRKLEDIYSGEGVNPRNLKNTSIITGILLPLSSNFLVVFNKLRERQSLDFTSLTSSFSIDNSGKIRIVLAGVDPGPVIVEGTINTGADIFVKEALKKARSIDNEMLSRKYRREMIRNFITNSLNKLKSSKIINE
ncbi:MAG: FAD binding domain-containing protein [Ignavibacteria bacterium]|nr:FAD binding domain-containing protein [Ignavibacteria bacterium]MCC7158214.1 FAD binding domain-containing protein [Ignavibacteria bacterium]